MPIDEAHRLAIVHSLGILDTEPEPSFDALTACAAELTGCPIAALSLIDETRQWMKAVHGAPREQLPRRGSLCAHALLHGPRLEISDAAADPRFKDNPSVCGPPYIRLYAGVPLTVDGQPVGTLCVIDTVVRELTPAQRAALDRLATIANELLSGRERRMQLDEERLRLLDFARSSGDWMWETDAKLRYTWVSGTFEAITGSTPSSVYGQMIADSPLLDALGQPLNDGQTFHALLQARQHVTRVITDKPTPNGVLQISRSAVPVFDVQGRFTGYRGTARDVSAHIAGERHTHSQAELLRKLSSQAPGVIFQFRLNPDRSIRYLYASDACQDMFGVVPPADDQWSDATSPAEVCRMLHPSDRNGFMRSLFRAAASMSPWHREFRTLRDDAELTVRWLEVRAMPEPDRNGSVLWHGFVADITSRKETELALRSSEERWNMAARAAGIGIGQFNLVDGSVMLDRQACENHGLPFPTPHFTLTEWLALVHADEREATRAAVDQAIETRGMLELRSRMTRPDRSEATLEFFLHCIVDTLGQVVGLLGTCRDVTQQVAHEQLRRDKETAERASRAKSEFLSRVSHELRTPLNGILGFAQLMALDRVQPLASDQARRLDSVLHAGHHLLELINDVLNLARIEQQDFTLQSVPIDLHASATTCLSLIQPLADDAGIKIVPPERVAHWARGDGRAVEQVLINLLSNAIKYNRPGGQVRVSLHRSQGEVQIAVSDEGDGLSPSQQAQLFEPFNRLGAEQRRVEGTGLGLVIAKALSQAMQGQLSVASTVGVGSTFTLSLPQGSSPEQAHADIGALRPTQTGTPALLPKSVLYVEDEPLNRLLMQEIFKSRPQWRLEIATDGTDGLALLRRQAFDLVLVDMNLPDMDGLALMAQLRLQTQGSVAPPCVALSADAMQSQIDAALAAGFEAYWTKPIQVSQVLEQLDQRLRGRMIER